MKLKITALLWIIAAPILFAKQISINEAKKVAKNLYYERIMQFSDINFDNILFSEEFTITHNSAPIYYVFNLKDNKGFVIVAAEDNVYPILGYSFNGSYSENNQPPAFAYMMHNYKEQIVFVRDNNLLNTSEINDEWKQYFSGEEKNKSKGAKNVAPLLTTTWGQKTYYNDSCPADPGGTNGHVSAGCVATAMGQIMKYYGYPTKGTGSHSYTHATYGKQYANFGATTYNWANMPNSVTSSNSDVAQLLYHCGVATDMQYSLGGSGTSSTLARAAYINYFNYSAVATNLDFKDAYTDAAWKSILKRELDAARPIHYVGQNLSTLAAHAFVCDGYQNDDFHINWGFTSFYDGYYKVTALNPGSANFTGNQEIIMVRLPGVCEYCTGTKTLTNLTDTFDDGSNSDIYNNNSNCKWLIQPPGATSITLHFTSFQTETSVDYVRVYDGAVISGSKLLGNFSGSSLPKVCTSIGGSMLVYFISDPGLSYQGWQAYYTITTDIDENVFENSISLYPNPNNGSFCVNINNNYTGVVYLKIIDLTGRQLYQIEIDKSGNYLTKEFYFPELSGGIYFLSIEHENGKAMKYLLLNK